MAKKQGPQPPSSTPWVNKDGTPSLALFQYMKTVDVLLTLLAAGTVGPLVNAANDAAAAAGGVAIGGLYANSGAVHVRLK